MQILIRANEAVQPDPYLLWDSIFNPVAGVCDWALAGPSTSTAASFIGFIVADTLIVTQMLSGALAVGAQIVADGVAAATVITGFESGTGGAGAYKIAPSQTVGGPEFAASGAGAAPLNAGGLAAAAGLETAVNLCLFTDAALPPAHPLAYLADDGDPRGWWGDGVDVRTDLGEAPLGSLLWLLQRAPLTPQIAMWAQQFAIEALAVLQQQGVVVKIAAAAVIAAGQQLQLSVQLYGHDGANIYNRQFDLLWKQL